MSRPAGGARRCARPSQRARAPTLPPPARRWGRKLDQQKLLSKHTIYWAQQVGGQRAHAHSRPHASLECTRAVAATPCAAPPPPAARRRRPTTPNPANWWWARCPSPWYVCEPVLGDTGTPLTRLLAAACLGTSVPGVFARRQPTQPPTVGSTPQKAAGSPFPPPPARAPAAPGGCHRAPGHLDKPAGLPLVQDLQNIRAPGGGAWRGQSRRRSSRRAAPRRAPGGQGGARTPPSAPAGAAGGEAAPQLLRPCPHPGCPPRHHRTGQ